MELKYQKNRFRGLNRKTQIVLTAVAFVLAVAVLVAWLIISIRLDKAKESKENIGEESSYPAATVYSEDDRMHLLLIFDEVGHEKFTVIIGVPDKPALELIPLSGEQIAPNGLPLDDLYRKTGAVAATEAVAALLNLPLTHYIAMDGEESESWINYLENGINLTLQEAIPRTVINGTVLQLEAGERTLTATQTTALLCYDGWSSPVVANQVHADVIAAMLKKYFNDSRHFGGDFARIANGSQTSLRISDYNAHTETIEFLAGALQIDPTILQFVSVQKD